PAPPLDRRVAATVGRFGHARRDDYAWLRPRDWPAVLRDPDTLEAPIRAQVLAENAYAEAMLAPCRPLQRQLRVRIEALDALQPAPPELASGGYAYATRVEGESLLYVRRPLAGGAEQLLLDSHADAAGSRVYVPHWNGPRHSADGRLFGWAVDLNGAEQYRIRVREIDSGRLLVDDIAGVDGEFAFSTDGRYLYWTDRDPARRSARVNRRDLAEGGDAVIHAETDPTTSITLRTSAADGFLVIRIDNCEQSEVRLVPMDRPASAPVPVEPRRAGLDYDVDEWNGQLLILTDADGAVDRKLMLADPQRPGRAHWRPLLPHRPGTSIAALHPFARALVREEWRDALPQLVWRHADGRERVIGFELAAYALAVPDGQAWDAEALLFARSAPASPPAWYRLDLDSGEFAPLAPPSPQPGFDPRRYEVRRLGVATTDGEVVPVTVLMRAGQALDGSAPLYLHGYGSYGMSADADFQPAALALVERGWIHAIAHVRGGGERGPRWWRSVLRRGKQKTFDDFIACAEALVAGGYTRKGRIVGHGLSAGGLLMGAVYTQRPDLWAGVVALVAFVDVLTSLEYFQEHPLGATALPIWGDPRIPAEHDYIAGYSPYDRLRPAAYPALLATGALSDGSVSFWEPLKFAMKARALTTAGHPILSLTALAGGHFGELGVGAGPEQQALFLAFAEWAVQRRWGEVPQRPAGAERAA
ncbi:MAG: prolyl oligopeptidase family serine peptidase, partial [Pseudoxanthomonas sp.]